MIISRALAELAEFLRHRQESAGRGHVILDRRIGERRRAPQPVDSDRRQADRRQSLTESTEALMRVLGFMVVPTNGSQPASASPRVPTRPAKASRAPRRRSQRAAPGHRPRRGRS